MFTYIPDFFDLVSRFLVDVDPPRREFVQVRVELDLPGRYSYFNGRFTPLLYALFLCLCADLISFSQGTRQLLSLTGINTALDPSRSTQSLFPYFLILSYKMMAS